VVAAATPPYGAGMTRASLLTLSLLLCLAAALPASASALRGFKTPSGNIHCQGYGGEVRCDIRRTTNGKPPRPAWCDFDYGTGYATKPGWKRGKRLCVSDTVYDAGHRALAYGASWRYGSVTCRSRMAGLTCRNGGGHGFFLSIGSQRVF